MFTGMGIRKTVKISSTEEPLKASFPLTALQENRDYVM